MNIFDRMRKILHMEAKPRPRRAKRLPRKPFIILAVAALGLIGVMTAAAVMLPPRMAANQMPEEITAEVSSPSMPEPTPTKSATARKTAKVSPKPSKSSETHKPIRTQRPVANKKKPAPAPKVIGYRYTCVAMNVRTAPNRSAKVVDTLPARNKVRIMNRVSKDWRMVRVEKKNRWMYAPCLWNHRPPKPKPLKSPSPSTAPKKTTNAPKTTKSNYSSGSTVWDRLAKCESGGNWAISTGNGFYGGLQFTLSTWKAYGGSGYPHKASREEQIRIAKKVLAGQGWGAWPACSSKLGLR